MTTSTTIPIQIRVDKKTKEEANELFEGRCKHFLKRDSAATAQEFISD